MCYHYTIGQTARKVAAAPRSANNFSQPHGARAVPARSGYEGKLALRLTHAPLTA